MFILEIVLAHLQMALRTAVVACFILFPIIVEPTQLIDRKSVVERHTIKFEGVVTTNEKQGSSPLTLAVGNGMIAFNADITGFQTLNESYQVFPLTTLSDWGWHSTPPPPSSNKSTPFSAYEYKYYNTSSSFGDRNWSKTRKVPYPTNMPKSAEDGGSWLRENPHRLDLIQVALRRRKSTLSPLRIDVDIDSKSSVQVLEPYTGLLRSNFTFHNAEGNQDSHMAVQTVCHMDLDIIAWRVEGNSMTTLQNKTRRTTDLDVLVAHIAFPYGSSSGYGGGYNWNQPANPLSRHTTTIIWNGSLTNNSVLFHRKLDWDEYNVICSWQDSMVVLKQDGPHSFYLDGLSSTKLDLSCLLAPPNANYPIKVTALWLKNKVALTRDILAGMKKLPLFDEIKRMIAQSWSNFWHSGAFVDLANEHTGHHFDASAFELERRIILSLYLTRIHSSGSLPPQETGYVINSWYGKFHHEMRFFHHCHFVLWQRSHLMQRSDHWFVEMIPNATAYAKFQGYDGARWPKMAAPATTPCKAAAQDSSFPWTCFNAPSVGSTTYSNNSYPLLYWTGPSGTGPLLIWQQPHIIWMTELQRLYAPNSSAKAAIVRRMEEVIELTADFMASYPTIGNTPNLEVEPQSKETLWLGPPLKAAEEGNPEKETWNPTFELTYWRIALQIAKEWRTRAGLPSKPAWENVLKSLAEATIATAPKDGKFGPYAYAPNANCWGFPDRSPSEKVKKSKHQCSGAYKSHPMTLGALGMINGLSVNNANLNTTIMNSTLSYSIDGWDYLSTWGWDYPIFAFAQMRLKWSSESVVDMLLKNTSKNTYLQNGHNFQAKSLPVYLPGNGGLLAAVAMMAGGFADAQGNKVDVGFPIDWGARSEGFLVYP